ncbi:phosphoserine phosphatase SerB [Stappia stellulata]|uniref:phosphoserine phosphatase SerB n=1 Tax=Stappia stellulata TaxID=71235 RepID=UPI00040C2034|nr:phosphoserine phosphatase SerB [Stappia stellulata]
MTLVATLIADPQRPVLDAKLLDAARAVLPEGTQTVTLDAGRAADLLFNADPASAQAFDAALRNVLGELPVDLLVQKRAGRRKRLLIADMDSTMIGQECIDELADALDKKAAIAAITERAMRGELEFAPALRERAAMLRGLDASVIETVLERQITLTPGARTLVQTMRRDGAYCALVSGGFTAFTEAIADRIGFHENRANTLVVADGKLTGEVGEPILGREAKRERLETLLAEQGLAAEDAIAVGDGANDLAMIARAGLGVAYHAKPSVAAAADARIDHGDLSALLYLQGYAKADFAE